MNQNQTVQYDMEGLIEEWCMENGFGSDPVIVSTITGLAWRLLDSLPYTQPYDCLGSADPPETQHTPAEAFETPAAPEKPADIFSLDTSGSWRKAFHHNSWWAVGYHMAYPARNKDDAQRICKQLSGSETMTRVVRLR